VIRYSLGNSCVHIKVQFVDTAQSSCQQLCVYIHSHL